MGFDLPQLMNQPPQVFGGFNPDGSPIPAVLNGPIFSDDGTGGSVDDNNDAKRRRIARVSTSSKKRLAVANNHWKRPAICAERRRSNAMERCQNVPIASTTKRSAPSRRWKRNAILPRGKKAFVKHYDRSMLTVPIEQNTLKAWRIALDEWSRS